MRRSLLITAFLLMILAPLAMIVRAQDVPVEEIEIGDTAEGTLDEDAPFALYTFTGTAGMEITVTLVSVDFDAYLLLFNEDGSVLAEDDDSAGRLNSMIEFTLPADGEYMIRATSLREFTSDGEFFATGDYTVTLDGEAGTTTTTTTTTTEPQGDSLDVGDTVTDELTRNAPTAEYTFSASAGDVVTITLMSDEFDAYLFLEDPDGVELQFDDDSAGDLNARIGPYEIPEDGTYTVIVDSYNHAAGDGDPETGMFTLSLAAATIETIEYTQEVSGELTTGDPTHIYRFEGEEDDVITVTLDTASSSVFVSLDEIDGDFLQQTYGGSDVLGPIVVTEPTDYLLTVETYDTFEPGAYSLVVERVTPETIAYNEEITADFDEDTVLYYTFEGEAGEVISVQVDSAGAVDTLVSVTGPSGTEIAFDDDSGEGFDPEIMYLPLAGDGTYSLLIRPFIAGDNGEFTLIIEDSALPSLEEGPQVVRISDKQSIAAVTFDGIGGERVILSARVLAGAQDEPRISVTQDDTTLATNTIGMVERLALEFVVPEDGTVYVTVEDLDYTPAIVELSVAHGGDDG